VAGGSGNRMGSEIPKQFIEFCGLPVLMHTMVAFKTAYENIEIIIVLPEGLVSYWESLCSQYNFKVHHQLAFGGETRFHSVKNGLELISGEGLVGIHDGVRPLVSKETIVRCYTEAAKYSSAIPVIEVVETVRVLEDNRSKIIDRSKLRLVQTPQVFEINLLKQAYQQSFNPAFTDDASVFESSSNEIHLTLGNKENIKITHPADLIMGESLFRVLNLI